MTGVLSVKKIKITALSLFFALLISILYTVDTWAEQKQLAENILRLHIVAHSDSAYDQDLKLQVRDRTAAQFSELLSRAENAEEACITIHDNLHAVEETAEAVLRENGCMLTADAEIVTMYFPERHYSDVTLPAGNYRALRIVLGEGEGKNWWCVVFPQLCLGASGTELRKTASKAGMTDKQMDLLFGKDTKITVKFKLLELFYQLTGQNKDR